MANTACKRIKRKNEQQPSKCRMISAKAKTWNIYLHVSNLIYRTRIAAASHHVTHIFLLCFFSSSCCCCYSFHLFFFISILHVNCFRKISYIYFSLFQFTIYKCNKIINDFLISFARIPEISCLHTAFFLFDQQMK